MAAHCARHELAVTIEVAPLSGSDIRAGSLSASALSGRSIGRGLTLRRGTLSVAAPLSLASSANTATLSGTNTGAGDGVFGSSANGTALHGTSSGGFGVVASSNAVDGVQGTTSARSFSGVSGFNTASAGKGYGGYFTSSSSNGVGVHGTGGGTGVSGSGGATGVEGGSDSGRGVEGFSSSGLGVNGHSISGDGVFGFSPSGVGIYGFSTSGKAGRFVGPVEVTGTLTAGNLSTSGMKDFKIDDPLDPANKFLIHSSIESPTAENVYNGNITTDGKGFATVSLPRYFDAENTDPRYQLTVTSSNGWNARVVKPIADNQFVIQTDSARVTVSWQVTAIRNDPYARTNRGAAERPKPASERGRYLYPQGFGKGARYAIGG